MNTKDIVKFVKNNNPLKVKETFRSCLNTKIREKLESKKVEIAQKFLEEK